MLTHIESEPATIEQPEEDLSKIAGIEQAMRSAAAAFPEIADVHDIIVGRTGEHISRHLPLHPARRPSHESRARGHHRARRPLQAGVPRGVPGDHPSRAGDG